MRILNLTQHPASEEQKAAGVEEPENKEEVKRLLTFREIPPGHELVRRANVLANRAAEARYQHVMIGGAPFFMSALERALGDWGIQPLYAFSRRESVEAVQEDGAVKKVA